MELNEDQFGNAVPKKWLTDEEYYKRFNEERDAKQDYNDEDKEAFRQHMSQWRLMMPLRSLAKKHRKGDKTAIDEGMNLFKDYSPTREGIIDLLKFAHNADGDELIKRMDTHFGGTA